MNFPELDPSGRKLARLRRLIEQRAWVALDTETTGLGVEAEMVEIGIVDPSGVVFERVVRPEGEVAREAAEVHGIEAGAITAAEPFAEVAVQVRRRLSRRTVIAYNADFDRSILWRAFAQAQQPAPSCRWLCLSRLMTNLTGSRHSLRAALQLLGETPVTPIHRAAADARSVVRLSEALARLTGHGS